MIVRLIASAAILVGLALPTSPAQAASYEASAPQNIQVTAGNGQATIAWDPPAYNGGWDTLTYWVTTSDYMDECKRAWSSSEEHCPVMGFAKGVNYTFDACVAGTEKRDKLAQGLT